jgi:hypothetical protein
MIRVCRYSLFGGESGVSLGKKIKKLIPSPVQTKMTPVITLKNVLIILIYSIMA